MFTSLRRLAGMILATVLIIGLLPGAARASSVAVGTGTVSGRITDAGDPVADVTVILQLAAYPVSIATTVTGADGGFSLDAVPAAYKVRFELPGGLVQFHPGRADFASAATITVVDGQTVLIDEVVMPHGSLGGQITTSTGMPAPGASVGLAAPGGAQIGMVQADAAGRYLFRFVGPGTFRVSVAAAKASAPRQWVRQHKNFADAEPVVVAVGQLTTVDERLLPLGTISGRFTDAAGPVSNVLIRADSRTSPNETVFASTAADGTFTLRAYPGSYTVKFSPTGGLDQWAGGQESQRLAWVLTLAADAQIVLDERALPTGRVSGRLTDAAGLAVAGAAVVIANPSLDRFFQATTDSAGAWFATVWPGTYQVRFETTSQVQWAHGRTSPTSADPIAVSAGQTTVVDDTLAVPGSLTVTAVDERTGVALISFCATATTEFLYSQACTEDGSAEFTELGAGSYTVTVSDGVYLDSARAGVRVSGGRASTFTAAMRRGATIAVRVIDAVTGAPVTNVCVNGLPADRPMEPGQGLGDCTDSAGTLTLTRIQPDRYVLFAAAFDGQHGAQWVGPNGGVGAQASAKVVTARSGAVTNVTVRLDGRGSIAGVITDRATAAPVEGAQIGVWGASAVSGADGHYVLDGLGPYPWVVFVGHNDYAGQWSGGGSSRLTATPVRVRLNQTSRLDVALRRGTVLTGRITGAAGQPPDSAEITVVNAQTFDQVAQVSSGPDGVYTIHLAGPQEVKLLILATFDSLPETVWYRDGGDFAHGRTVSIPASGSKTLNLPFP